MLPGRISFYLIYHSVGEDTTKSMTDTVKFRRQFGHIYESGTKILDPDIEFAETERP